MRYRPFTLQIHLFLDPTSIIKKAFLSSSTQPELFSWKVGLGPGMGFKENQMGLFVEACAAFHVKFFWSENDSVPILLLPTERLSQSTVSASTGIRRWLPKQQERILSGGEPRAIWSAPWPLILRMKLRLGTHPVLGERALMQAASKLAHQL